MDVHVQLALIEKAKRIFATNDQLFLTFPVLWPINFAPETLPAILSPQTPADYAQAQNFARICNFIPRDMVALADGETFLWDIYQDVLERGQPGSAPPNPATDATRAAALAILYTTNSDGQRQETAIYKDYRRYRDAWFVAQEDYASRRISAENQTDPAILTAWHEVDEPRLRAAIEQAKVDWEGAGHRSQVETALAEEQAAAASDPQTRWADWRASFNPDLDMLGVPGARFAPTGFSPTDLSAESSWLQASMDAAEIADLETAAPAQLRVSGDPSEIERVAFEFRSVAITRPWFNSAVLTSRIWRGAQDQEPLSEGDGTATGRLPAYVSAIVLIRNVVVTPKSQAAPTTSTPFAFTLAAQDMTTRVIPHDAGLLLRMRSDVLLQTVDHTADGNRAFANLRSQTFTAAPNTRELSAMAFHRPLASIQIAEQPAVMTATRFEGMSARIPFRGRPFNLERVAAGSLVDRAPLQIEPDPPAAAPPPPPPPLPDPTIAVLAFICKRLPRAPNPLPELTWS